MVDARDEETSRTEGAATPDGNVGPPRHGAIYDGVFVEADVEVALLDPDGTIVWVNDAWRDFALANGGDAASLGIGASYLAACEADAGDAVADAVAAAVRSALAGELPAPMTIRIPCDGPDDARWFDVLISSRTGAGGTVEGASVTLSP